MPWWRHAVVYQVYLQSFADSNGDGVGDICGLIGRLPYLRDLGVDAVWITPWYPSPFHDGGYDVADYCDIDPRFGTLDHAKVLIQNAHALDLKVIIDLVPNHTSTDHRWFREALASPPGSAERDRYLFRSGRGPDGSLPPSNWESIFGGPAWERAADGEWYLHSFAPTQADLNWDNPEVVASFDEILRFWLDVGVDGFRVDVAHGLFKDDPTVDLELELEPGVALHRLTEAADHPMWDRDRIHDIVRRWRRIVDEYGDRLMVAEAVVHPARVARYLQPGGYHQSFNFDLLETDWDARQFHTSIERSMRALEETPALPTWVVSNHDVVRPATRYGLPVGIDWYRWSAQGPHDALDVERGARRARAIALVTLALPGSAYIYQGEELGLPEVWDLPVEVLRDPTWEQSGHTLKGRDGCRVPIPWDADRHAMGFSTAEPWLPQPPEFLGRSVAEQLDDERSSLSLYRSAIGLRSTWLRDGDDLTVTTLGSGDVLALGRAGGFTCLVNMGDEPFALPEGSVILASNPDQGRVLEPDCAVWMVRPDDIEQRAGARKTRS
ncbi:MAG: glycoside hydrolase family 13 protein [Acidimicrobiales bacterium]